MLNFFLLLKIIKLQTTEHWINKYVYILTELFSSLRHSCSLRAVETVTIDYLFDIFSSFLFGFKF